MSVIPLLVLCSLVLVGFAIVAFCWSVKHREHEHADRLSLLPLEDDDAVSAAGAREDAVD